MGLGAAPPDDQSGECYRRARLWGTGSPDNARFTQAPGYELIAG
jgi:hypothetical protein